MEELDKQKEEAIKQSKKELLSIKVKIEDNQKKQDRLIDLYLEKIISDNEYKKKKNKLADEKSNLNEKKKGVLEEKISSWFEPLQDVIKTCNRASKLNLSSSEDEKREILEKVGSNLFLKDKKLVIEFKKGYKILASKGFLTPGASAGAFSESENSESRGNPSSLLPLLDEVRTDLGLEVS